MTQPGYFRDNIMTNEPFYEKLLRTLLREVVLVKQIVKEICGWKTNLIIDKCWTIV